ncbi:hypothetical protein O1611_g1964 [Lasiodiplodia mahajangana]|uniref:Uncharacterized protein n=1 Tax=Lasiodiplodia mahajangana TaxID=1108764 RepID=A0ACC2JVW7_9PEZI|nr:hypothetical protein O1611_g1964 [Lasiodiplodia mahajangana]
MAQRTPITVLSLSQDRAFVRDIHNHICLHGFNIGGILESRPFSEGELARALRLLEPRPQALLIDRGYNEIETSIAWAVFSLHMRKVGIEKGKVIKITPEIFAEVGKEGVPKWMLDQLEDCFGT